MSAMALDLNSIQTHISALNKLGENDLSQALSNEASFELRKNLRKLDLALRTPDQIVEDVIFTVLLLIIIQKAFANFDARSLWICPSCELAKTWAFLLC